MARETLQGEFVTLTQFRDIHTIAIGIPTVKSKPVKKTVYILGAGFSQPAGGPSQAAIMRKVMTLPPSPNVDIRLRNLKSFLTGHLGIPTDKLANVSLEDVYTPIDRCIADGVSLRGKTPIELQELRSNLDSLIAIAIEDCIGRAPRNQHYVKQLAEHLVAKASHRAVLAADANTAAEAKQYDPFAVISLNWDILLDNAIARALRDADQDRGTGDYDPFGVVDYCCYVSSLESDDGKIRSGLWSLGSRGYNVKLLKIHGSMNWLQCTNCQRLFTAFGDKLILSDENGKECRHCQKHGIHARLRGTLVMPTFLKDLTNFQLKLVWQNAGVELMEARRLVFIGYSLPDADFEFRQLLTRTVHRDAEIEAVLWGESNGYDREVSRYNSFFPQHSINFEPEGVEKFVNTECGRQ